MSEGTFQTLEAKSNLTSPRKSPKLDFWFKIQTSFIGLIFTPE
jgi:hypothetical protein